MVLWLCILVGLLGAGLVLILTAVPVSTNAEKLAYVNFLETAGGPLLAVQHHLSNANIVPTPATTLADLTECVFTGYAPVAGLNPSVAYIGPDNLVHATYPSELFLATNGGQAQQISNLAVGPITGAGNVSVVVTASGLVGSPITTPVAVGTADSNNTLATKIAAALRLVANINNFFGISTSANAVVLTAKTPAANDGSMNMSFTTGTATGLTAEPTATQVLPGIATPAFVPDTAYLQFATDATGSVLLWAHQLDAPVTFAAPGDGKDLSLDYVYGA